MTVDKKISAGFVPSITSSRRPQAEGKASSPKGYAEKGVSSPSVSARSESDIPEEELMQINAAKILSCRIRWKLPTTVLT